MDRLWKHYNFFSSSLFSEMDQKLNFAKECKGPAFTTSLIGFTLQLSCWRMMMNQVVWKKFVEKPPTFVPVRKSSVMRAIFAGPLLTPLFLAALSLQLTISVWESALGENEHMGAFFWLCLGPFSHSLFLWEFKFLWPAWNIEWKVVRIVLCDFRMSEKNRNLGVGRYFWHLKRLEMTQESPSESLLTPYLPTNHHHIKHS